MRLLIKLIAHNALYKFRASYSLVALSNQTSLFSHLHFDNNDSMIYKEIFSYKDKHFRIIYFNLNNDKK